MHHEDSRLELSTTHGNKKGDTRFQQQTYETNLYLHCCSILSLDPTKSEWADYAAVQAQCGKHWSGNTRSQLSQLAEPLWTDPGLKSGIRVRELTATFKRKALAGNELSNILLKSSNARKKVPAPLSLIHKETNKGPTTNQFCFDVYIEAVL